jgi:hypothetical protein
MPSQPKKFACTVYQGQRKPGNHYLADGSDNEWAKALFPHIAKVRPQPNSGEGEQKSPA